MNRNQVVSVLLLLLVNENCLQESRGDSLVRVGTMQVCRLTEGAPMS